MLTTQPSTARRTAGSAARSHLDVPGGFHACRQRSSIRVLLSALVAAALSGCQSDDKEATSLIKRAGEVLGKGDFQEAERLALSAARIQPDSGAAWRIAGDAAAHQERFERALGHFEKIPKHDLLNRVEGCTGAAQVLVLGLKRLSEGEAKFREAHALQPDNVEALDGLSYLLSMTGRRWESAPYFLALIRGDRHDLGHLLGIGVLEFMLNQEPQLRECRRESPGDPLPLLGLAHLAQNRKEYAKARKLLREAIQLSPDLLEAQARLGLVLLADGELEDLAAWHATLPERADDHPDIWVVRAQWAQRNNNKRGAARCYFEALRLAPNHQLAASQVAVVLFSLGERELANRFALRSQQLLRYHEVIYQLRQSPRNPQFIAVAAQRAEVQGRLWEARGWYEQLLKRGVDRQRTNRIIQQLKDKLTSTTPQVLREKNPAWDVQLDDWPLPAWIAPATGRDRPYLGPAAMDVAVRFTDVAESAGLHFRYQNGHDSRRIGPRIYEVDGGGVAILDYDGDGWPDIYFTQGCRWPPDPDQTEYHDRLFRNLGNGRFQDVTELAGLRENGFGQGVAVGDIDNDGFPDLLVGNLGPNRLYHNRGDGTFEDITSQAGLTGNVWTSSCAIADLNADGFADIYEVNYLKDEEKMFDRVCPDGRGTPRVCAPLVFDAEQDRLYVGLGDGTFRECGAEAGIHVGDGKGLGIVVADFDDSGRLSAFIANDVVENFYLYNETAEPGAPIRFAEQALLRGLAFGDNGQAQACMGVAAGDPNMDGRLDLLVANFHEEPNCLYIQQPDGSFVDESRSANLQGASYTMLGFGTQFLDGELDGQPDLVVTNGHLVNETDLGVPYRMRSQYFRNLGNARFTELHANVIGPFFNVECLGRGLAKLDWNRDGREDFAITFLDRPAALLTNETPNPGHFLAVSLRATRSQRDAIGAKVTVDFAGFTSRQQLFAGDGYQVSNQRQLVFGLGRTNVVDRLHIRWPSGSEQTWNDLPADSHLILIEGRDAVEHVVR